MAVSQPISIRVVISQPVHLWIETIRGKKNPTHCPREGVLWSGRKINVWRVEHAARAGLCEGRGIQRGTQRCRKNSEKGWLFHLRLAIERCSRCIELMARDHSE